MPVDINFVVGGEAGQGVQTVGFLLGKVFARGGYHVFADQDYESRVRGGHNFFRVRVSDRPIGGVLEPVDALIALNQETIELHRRELSENGVVIFDGEKISLAESGPNLFNVPLERLADEKAGGKVMANTVALGAALCLVKYDFSILEKVLREYFGAEVGEDNVKAAKVGYEYLQENFGGKLSQALPTIKKNNSKQMLLTGNDAIALGAIAAGCKFISAYPMTPATSILEYMATKAGELGLAVVQTEDEISAVNMAIGAAFAGARAITATSGSGFCLMVEGLGLAGITETPVVIVDAQRPGPAVGMPTRTEQGDLQFVLHAHQGDFPRAVFAPASVEDAFWLTVKAFNVADKYQLPVIILTDHHLATSYATVNRFDLSQVTIDRGLLFSSKDGSPEEYKRHKVTPTGISPRAFPGGEALVVTDSDEHDEEGHMIEDAPTRTAQMQKRLRKMFGLKTEIAEPRRHGPAKADMVLIGWGSTYGAIREAVDLLRKDGESVKLLHFSELWPFPSEAVIDTLSKAKMSFVIENNASGQLARLIRAQTGKEMSGMVLKYDGRPFTPAHVAREIHKEVCRNGHSCSIQQP
ncbi:MAG: 2-oxoacid:acceptor oxidoreductase subunit alpha [Chloroflexota bacterium]